MCSWENLNYEQIDSCAREETCSGCSQRNISVKNPGLRGRQSFKPVSVLVRNTKSSGHLNQSNKSYLLCVGAQLSSVIFIKTISRWPHLSSENPNACTLRGRRPPVEDAAARHVVTRWSAASRQSQASGRVRYATTLDNALSANTRWPYNRFAQKEAGRTAWLVSFFCNLSLSGTLM